MRSLDHDHSGDSEDEVGGFDVIVVGGGPSGSVCSYFLASAGVRVLILEKESFPRDKVCGDLVCYEALYMLKEMGVWQRILEKGCFRWVNHAALIGSDVEVHSVAGTLRKNRPLAIQRYVLDEELIVAARGAGALLQENHKVVNVQFDQEKKRWQVLSENGSQFHCKGKKAIKKSSASF